MNVYRSSESGEEGFVLTSEVLRAHLAMLIGYEDDFTLFDGGRMIDAECDDVPQLSELCLKNPELVGAALKWLADNK